MLPYKYIDEDIKRQEKRIETIKARYEYCKGVYDEYKKAMAKSYEDDTPAITLTIHGTDKDYNIDFTSYDNLFFDIDNAVAIILNPVENMLWKSKQALDNLLRRKEGLADLPDEDDYIDDEDYNINIENDDDGVDSSKW